LSKLAVWWLRLGIHIERIPPGHPQQDGRHVIDKFTCECLASDVAGGIRSGRVIELLARLISERGAPVFLRSDNGSEFIGHAILSWLAEEGIETAPTEFHRSHESHPPGCHAQAANGRKFLEQVIATTASGGPQ
jgi:transposase InsO family protein